MQSKLEVGKIYLCRDGSVIKLTEIERGFLGYDLGDCNEGITRVVWHRLSKTYRGQVEKDFLEGVIIESEAALLRYYRQKAIADYQDRIKTHTAEIKMLKIKITQLQNLNDKDKQQLNRKESE